MERKMELLAPGGDVDSIKSAILAGADAVYCGLDKFNARNRASNVDFDELHGVIHFAHENNCEVFLTLNVVLHDRDIASLFKLLNRLVNTEIDAVIVQDLGLFYLLKTYFRSLNVHASTQVTTHNRGQIDFFSSLGAERVNLSRELSLAEIKHLATYAQEQNVGTEVFVHGSYCISFSGLCYMSAFQEGNSANRGRCSQPCRQRYKCTPQQNNYPLNMKDNSAYTRIKELMDMGVDSLKIEGRIKESEYVHTVVKAYREQVDRILQRHTPLSDETELYKVFNRNFTSAYLRSEISKEMFIDSPTSYSTKHFSNKKVMEQPIDLHNEKQRMREELEKKLSSVSIEKQPVRLSIEGTVGSPLVVSITTNKAKYEVLSDALLSNQGTEALTEKMLYKRMKAINDTQFLLKELAFALPDNLYLPLKELSVLKRKVLLAISDGKEAIKAKAVPVLPTLESTEKTPRLSVLISSPQEIVRDTEIDLYVELPNHLKGERELLVGVFLENKDLIPWFPSVLIGEDFDSAVQFLQELNPKRIVTNNTGIAFEANKRGIEWIAGPEMNTSNSFSLVALNTFEFCVGSFLSTELTGKQLKHIKSPQHFEVHLPIYQPILQMTSRQCLYQQVEGCEKTTVDSFCRTHCTKSTWITNAKQKGLYLEKSKGRYHRIYHEQNLLNTEVAMEKWNHLSHYFVDLRAVKTNTRVQVTHSELIELFKSHITGEESAKEELHRVVTNTNNDQYINGVK